MDRERNKRYHIWTIGCQMNEADSGRVAAELEDLGYTPTTRSEEADVIVLNTCVVRQSAEDRAVGHLWSIRPLKQDDPGRVIALMGCMVGIRPDPALRQRFPFVDVFMPPSDPSPLIRHLKETTLELEARETEELAVAARHRIQDMPSPEASAVRLIEGDSPEKTMVQRQASALGSPSSAGRPRRQQSLSYLAVHGQTPVTANVSVVYGCSHACAYCIIPLRRGVERSRPLPEVVREIEDLVSQGVREVTLLGQIVDRYGADFPSARPNMADLLRAVHDIPGLWRIRFLTSHPSYMSDQILQAVAELPKVCEQIEVPVQAGDDDVLRRMKRGYTSEHYRQLVHRIRALVPGAAVHSDVIVGFPGETAEQFERTRVLLTDLKLDKVHLAMYSPRPGTLSARRMTDDVPAAEKKRRWEVLDQLQAQIVGEINRGLVGETVEVLVEERHKGRWRGRTRTNKLVFFDHPADWRGRLAAVRIIWAGPWSMIGDVLAE